MQNTRPDLRVQRTRRLLLQALFALTVERGYAAVTVRDITERAQVNRSTFYRNYLDKADLLNQYLDQLQTEVAEAAAQAEAASQRGAEHQPGGLVLLLRQVQTHADFYRVMLGSNGDPAFAARFRQLAERRYQALFARLDSQFSPQQPPNALKTSYISAAVVGAIVWWLEQGQPCTPEQLAGWMAGLSMRAAGLG